MTERLLVKIYSKTSFLTKCQRAMCALISSPLQELQQQEAQLGTLELVFQAQSSL